MIFNYGLAKNWEFVFQGQGQFPLTNPDESNSVNGVGAFLKHVLREGSLQDASGPSRSALAGPSGRERNEARRSIVRQRLRCSFASHWLVTAIATAH